jgi:RNA polymerase sigma-70 factor (ECF subfamily)
MRDAGVTALVDHLFRRQAGRIVAALARRLGPASLDVAEDVVQDALVQALRTWPFQGVPDDPAAWLYRVARNRALDVVRREAALHHRQAAVERWVLDAAEGARRPAGPADADDAGDDELALLYACCHPAVPREAGVALALKTVGGLGVGEIARAFLTAEATVAQRLVRAKRRLREAKVAIPETAAALAARTPAVLETLYLLFNEGYSASGGDLLVRRELCAEALRLARLVARHPAATSPAAHALAALMLFHAARLAARADDGGDPVLLDAQDRARWDTGLTSLAFRHLEWAAAGGELTRYHLEAEIASHHALAPSVERTNWPAVLAAYDALLRLAPSPVVGVHRAVAVGMVRGPAAALAELAAVADADGGAQLARYPWFYATRAHWLARAGRTAEAAADYRRAGELATSAPVRRFLAARLDALLTPAAPA